MYILRKILLSIALLLPWTSALSQTEKKESPLSIVGKKIMNHLDKSCIEGFDTTYVGLPKYPFLASTSAIFAGIKTSLTGKDVPNFGSVGVNIRSALKGQSSLGISYRGLLLKYSWDVFNGYNSDIQLSWFERAWGIEYRHHATDGVHGSLSSSATGNTIHVLRGDLNVKTTMVYGYAILNSKKFCYMATMFPTLIQKRSAGTVMLVGGYMNTDVRTDQQELITRLGGMKDVEITQAVVGIGYGYNYSINNGQVLLCASAIPLAVIHNNNLVTLDYTGKLQDGSDYTTEISKKVTAKRKVNFTGMLRFSANYNISKRFIMRVDALINEIRFDSSTSLHINTDDWYCALMMGVRF